VKFGSLFSGIGGMDLGLERAGLECAWQVEIDEFCRKVLTKHWPNVPKFNDVREVGKHNLGSVDLIAGGFPCQPFSSAGRRKGKDDNRHLWPEMLRVIQEVRPAWVLGENVAGIIGMELDSVLADLEGEDYATQAFVIPACAVNALHRRNRVWICAYAGYHDRRTEQQFKQEERGETMAHTNGARQSQSGRGEHEQRQRIVNGGEDLCNAASERFPNWSGGSLGQPSPLTEFELPDGQYDATDSQGNSSNGEWEGLSARGRNSKHSTAKQREIERDFRGVAYGVSRRVDRLRSLGNAVVPLVVQRIGERIIAAHKENK
jgi:DNA (cytosine-5)-methyltransferase 1